MNAKGKDLRINVSTDKKTALGKSSEDLPNVMYFPTDDDSSIIFNGRIYDLNRLITNPVTLGNDADLDVYKGISNTGVYIGRSANSILNKPSGVDGFVLQSFCYTPEELTYQVLYSEQKIFNRRYINKQSSWTPWKVIEELPIASASGLGGVKLGYTNTSQNYKLQVDANGNAYTTVTWRNTTYNDATASTSGLMSASDKSKLDGITSSADAVSFSRALSSGKKIGAITINGTNTDIYAPAPYTAGTGLQLAGTVLAVKLGYTTSGKNYKVQADSNGNLYVNVPWTDNNTTYRLASTTGNGLLKQLSGNTSQFMRGDGNWATPPNTVYPIVSSSSDGLVSKNSPLESLASDDKDTANTGSLASFNDIGLLDVSDITESDLALVNKSNTWTVYQDFKSGAGNSGSDVRFKKEVQNIDNVLDKVNSLDVIKYIWKHPDEEGTRDTFGVRADQLLELGGIFATMVHSRGDEYDTKWVEYDRFGVLAIKAIQELLKKLEYCETEIAKLKTKL